MATALTVQDLNGAHAGALSAFTWEAADVAEGNEFPFTGDEIVLMHNTDTGAHNVTLTSVDDPYGRAENIAESIAADEYKAIYLNSIIGWRTSGGLMQLSADDATVEFAILRP